MNAPPRQARAVGYVRVSDQKQVESGLGLEAQELAIRMEAQRRGLELAVVERDEALGGELPIDERPGLLRAIGQLFRGDVLIVARRDRFARDVLTSRLLERLIDERGARLVSAAGEASDVEGPMGQFIRTILDAIAQYERALISVRTAAAAARLRAQGRHTGGQAPYGWEVLVDGRLAPVEREQRVVRLVREATERGLSLGQIARALERRGLRPRRGGHWRAEQIRRIRRRGHDDPRDPRALSSSRSSAPRPRRPS